MNKELKDALKANNRLNPIYQPSSLHGQYCSQSNLCKQQKSMDKLSTYSEQKLSEQNQQVQNFKKKLLSVASLEHQSKKEFSLTPIKTQTSKKSNKRVILKTLNGDLVQKKGMYNPQEIANPNPFKSVYTLDYQYKNNQGDPFDTFQEEQLEVIKKLERKRQELKSNSKATAAQIENKNNKEVPNSKIPLKDFFSPYSHRKSQPNPVLLYQHQSQVDKKTENINKTNDDLNQIDQDNKPKINVSNNEEENLSEQQDKVEVTQDNIPSMVDANDIKHINEVDLINIKQQNQEKSPEETEDNKKDDQNNQPNNQSDEKKPAITKQQLEQYINELIEENPEYFEHKAGKCLCSLCKCGQCQTKCQQLNSKLGQSLKLSWISSYQKDYSDYSGYQLLNNFNLKTNQTASNIFPSSGYGQNLKSTFKDDYQRYDSVHQPLKKHPPQQNMEPFYGITSYKTDFIGFGGQSMCLKLKGYNSRTTDERLPFLGKSMYSQDFQVFKSSFQKEPKPKDTLHFVDTGAFMFPKETEKQKKLNLQQNKQALASYFEDSHQKLLEKSSQQEQIPSYNGQYQSMFQKDYQDNSSPECMAKKIIKEKLLKRLQKQLDFKPQIIENWEADRKQKMVKSGILIPLNRQQINKEKGNIQQQQL